MDVKYFATKQGFSFQAACRLDAAVACFYVSPAQVELVVREAVTLRGRLGSDDAAMAEALRRVHARSGRALPLAA